MKQEYNFWDIEKKWQQLWNEKGYFRAEKDNNKEKFYTLVMFPYPSGRIHMGHVRNYTIGDIIARSKKLQGYNVMHPIGWDSFGLPAENAAIDNNIHPAKWTFENIDYMKSQLKKLGISYDWDREIASCTPEYYRWNQWFFLKMVEKGLVEKRDGAVNWCNKCDTVLANEQVEDGKCWRCGLEVEQKDLSQWYFKITDYAQELLDDHEQLEGKWPDRVLTMQKNWIGRSVGLKINFKLNGKDFPIFTTRADTIFGVTYMAIAPEHPLVKGFLETAENKDEIKAFVEAAKKESKIERTAEGAEKKGIFTGQYVEHPFTGAKIPLYIADFVLMEYGTGAVMAVPAHDQRDFQFAKKYNIPINIVIQPEEGEKLDAATMTEAYTADGVLVESGEFNGMKNREALEKIIDKADEMGLGSKTINYRLKDWLLSRQRYWGTPIPMVYCDKCGIVPEKEENLPIHLPKDVDFTKGGNPLLTSEEFKNVDCPVCGEKARRETDTMDTFMDSSWYYARYVSPKDDTAPFQSDEANYWLGVDQYIGGIEHAVMHLLYSRFFHKVMRDLGLLNSDEPFKKLLTQGMVVANSYFCKDCHEFFPPSDVDGEACPKCGQKLVIKIDKMSKSKKNGIDPDNMVENYGADTARLFMLFAAPPERDLEWSDQGIEGAHRFLKRVHKLCSGHSEAVKGITDYMVSADGLSKDALNVKKATHKTIQKVSSDFIDRYHFNTGIAAMMEFLNLLNGFKPADETELKVLKEALVSMVQLLFPVAPHVAEELYQIVDGQKPSLYEMGWPTFEEALTKDDEVTYAVQINGKVRANIEMEASADKDTVLAVVKENESIKKYTDGKQIIREIFVPKKLVNLVVK